MIDDDPRAAEDLALLAAPVMRIVVAAGSPEALAGLDRGLAVDAVVTDLHLPNHLARPGELEGLHLIPELRRRLGPKVPILVLSSIPRGDAEAACIVRGANGYLEKPCMVATLVWVLRELSRACSEEHPRRDQPPCVP